MRGGECLKLFTLVRKLQRALIAQGKPIKINQTQIWFEETGRMVTKYTVSKPTTDEKGKKKDQMLLESFRLDEVVKFLASLLDGGD